MYRILIFLFAFSFGFSDNTEVIAKNCDNDISSYNRFQIVRVLQDTTINYSLGDDAVWIKIFEGIPQSFIIINLHENEATSILAAKDIVNRVGGKFIFLSQKGERNISFKLGGNEYSFDPNRIFTREGIRKSLSNLGNYSFEAEEEVNKFAEFLLSELTKDSLFIIAVHNNTDGSYSINSFFNQYNQDVSNVYRNKSEDPDDFFFVVREEDFEYLKSKGFNVVLQDNQNVRDDGSLSVFCGRNNIPYINVETQVGKYQKQIQMLEEIKEYLSKPKEN